MHLLPQKWPRNGVAHKLGLDLVRKRGKSETFVVRVSP